MFVVSTTGSMVNGFDMVMNADVMKQLEKLKSQYIDTKAHINNIGKLTSCKVIVQVEQTTR